MSEKQITFRHFVYCPLTGVGITEIYRNEEWLKYRIEIFKKYTLNSLAQQTAKNFTLWISARPEEYKSQDVMELGEYIKKIGLSAIITFDGLMYYDDKFSKDLLSRAKNVARVMRKCWRTKDFRSFTQGIKQVLKDKNGTLKLRLASSLDNLKQHFYDADYVYVTRIDSDDMFRNTVIETIQSIPIQSESLVFRKGFVYNKQTGELAEWNPKTNPPFHTLIFKRDTFFDAKKHLELYGDWKSHEDTPKIFTYIRLPDYNYCVLVHSAVNQISTIWNHPFRKEIKLSEEEKKTILNSFGIEYEIRI